MLTRSTLQVGMMPVQESISGIFSYGSYFKTELNETYSLFFSERQKCFNNKEMAYSDATNLS